jgi:cbb3-type cytochrome oxidase subunit 1
MVAEPGSARAGVAELSAAEQEDFTRYTLWFVLCCVLYSIIGFGWGALMGGIKGFREFVDYSPYGHKIVLAHTHINLLGWVEMAIFAALYYVVPRLSGRPIYSVPLVKVHFWMHNFGLIGLVVFFSLAGMVGALPNEGGDADAPARLYHHIMAFTGFFGMLVLLANIIWGYNLLRTSIGWKARQ